MAGHSQVGEGMMQVYVCPVFLCGTLDSVNLVAQSQSI